jgi:lipopolysaccharide transport protein LptA/LPS export ABC transporter protein LptC
MRLRTVKIMRRSLIGLVIVVLLSVVFNYLQVWYRRARLVKKVAQILNPEMLRSFEGFEYSSTPNGVLRFRIKARHLVDKSEGKSYIEGIEAFDFNSEGSIRNAIHSEKAVFDREHNSAEFSGNVRIFLGAAFELRTNSLHYDFDAEKGYAPDRLQVISKTASGTAKGVVFDQGQNTLELQSEVDFVLTAQGNAVHGAAESRKFHAAADRAFCTDEMRLFVFQGRARIESDADALSGGRIEAVLSPDQKRIVSLISAGNASYRSEKAGEIRLIQGDRMVFGISNSQTLERINVAGHAVFSSAALSETQTLSGREIDLFFSGVSGNPLKIEGRGNVLFERKRGAEQIQVSGNTFVAAFSAESRNLQNVSVHEQAAMSIEDPEHSMHNELKSQEIRLRFQEADGRTYFDKLLAEGAARWTFQPKPKSDAVRREPARTLEASSLEISISREGNSFESGSASGNVVISENRSEAAGAARLSRLLADSAQFLFFPGNNRLRNMTAQGHVQANYEKRGNPKENPASEKFSATSDNMEVVFALLGGESAVESAKQWGNFIYQDASMTATAGRCEFDARKELLVLSESPRISDEMSSTSGERAEYELKQKAFAVFGRVRSRMNTKSGSGPFLAFSSSSPAIVTADEMHYWIAERRARYAGKVQVLSENGQLRAGRLDIIEGGDRVEAQDSIRHYIPQREVSKDAEQADKIKAKGNLFNAEMTIQSSTLKYGKQKNTILYGGRVAVRSGDLTLSSDTLEVEVTEKSGGIDRATARGKVYVRQKGKEGSADVAEYFLSPHRFVLTGNPAEIHEPGKVRTSAAQLTYLIADDRILFGDKQE